MPDSAESIPFVSHEEDENPQDKLEEPTDYFAIAEAAHKRVREDNPQEDVEVSITHAWSRDE